MGRWLFPAVLLLCLGCVPPCEERGSFDPPIVEWHAWEQAYELDPISEDVIVWADGRIEVRSGASVRNRILLTSSQMDRLFVLLSEVEFLRCDALDERLRGCRLKPRLPEVIRDVLLVYSPRPGLRRILRRSWGDGTLEEVAFTPECYAGLEAVDRYFRELLPD
jgi:hypothetical protein